MYSSSNSSSYLPAGDPPAARGESSAEELEPVGCWRPRLRQDIPHTVAPLVRRELVALTGLSATVIDLLYSRFRALAPTGFMTYHGFRKSLGMMALLDETFLIDRLFGAFDVRADGVLDFVEWCASLGIMMKGTDGERLEFSFRILRTPGKGVVRRGNSLQGPLWRGVQKAADGQAARTSTWQAIYGHSSLLPALCGGHSHADAGAANQASPQQGSRTWVTYLLATDPNDPSNVITLSEFVHIVRCLENTRSQLTTDLSVERIPDSVIQDVFERATQLSNKPVATTSGVLTDVLTLETYKLAVSRMPEFLELLGIPIWSAQIANVPMADDVYKTPRSTRRLLSDPGQETHEAAQSIETLSSVRSVLLKLVRLIDRAGYDNVAINSLLPPKRLRKSYSVAISRGLESKNASPARDELYCPEKTIVSTPEESPLPFDSVELHGAPMYSRCTHICAADKASDKKPMNARQHARSSPTDELPSGIRLRRISQALDPRRPLEPNYAVGIPQRHSQRLSLGEISSIPDNFLAHPKDIYPPNPSGSEYNYSSALSRLRFPDSDDAANNCDTPKSAARRSSDDSPQESTYQEMTVWHRNQQETSGTDESGLSDGDNNDDPGGPVYVGDDDAVSIALANVCANLGKSILTDEEARVLAYRLINWVENILSGNNTQLKGRRARMFVNATNFSVLRTRQDERQRVKKIARRPRRRRVESKILDMGGRKGLVVHFGHRSWNLVLNMMLGIRIAAFRCQTEPLHEIDSYDFLIRETFSVLPRVSNIIDKIKKYHYELVRFIDYAPMVFRRLRDIDGLNGAEYLDSVGPEKLLNNIVIGNLSSLSELYSEGKSGSIFYYTNDGRFIVKTIDSSSAKLLKNHILRSYYEHVSKNRDSLIIRIYGFHALKIQLSDASTSSTNFVGRKHRVKKLYFIVMKNIFHTNCIIHRRFDLKGSWIGRTTLGANVLDVRVSPDAVISLDPGSNEFRQTLSTTTAGTVKPPAWWDSTISLKDLDVVRLRDFVKLEPTLRDKILGILDADSRWLSQMSLIDYSLLLGVHVNSLSDHCVIPPQVPIRAILQPPQTAPEVFANAVMDADRTCQYFFGIVDILTLYNNTKRIEHLCKSLTKDRNGISCVRPAKYQDRFIKFMRNVFI